MKLNRRLVVTVNKVTLTEDQDKANNAFLDFLISDDSYFIIQGAAGTGKSFLIKHLLETFYSKYKSYCLLLQKDVKEFNIKVTATTNKAVSVVEDFLSGITYNNKTIGIRTIFSLLGLRVQNDRKTGKSNLTYNPNSQTTLDLGNQGVPLIFIDESSFIGSDLQEIIQTVLVDQFGAKIVYIGDKYQLAPVGQTFSVIDSLQCKSVSLNKIIRNKGHILQTGTQFRQTVETGKFAPILYNDVDVIHVNGADFQKTIEASFSNRNWYPNKSKILAWTNERVQAYNAHIRDFLNYPPLFKVGETVVTNEYIQGHKSRYTRSVDSEVLITNVHLNPIDMWGVKGNMIELDGAYAAFMPTNYADAKKLLKELAKEKDWKKYFEIKETWLDLRAVYSSSIHKAQGSTYETVFLDLSDIGKNWNAMDVARLMYVGITRASKQVVCYGYLPDRYC